MTSFSIKLIAVVAMIIDHIGIFLFPQYLFLWMHIIGRFSFPLFAWLIANGARHTSDVPRYGMRLFALALASQIPVWLVNRRAGVPMIYLNVVFTLTLGLLAIFLIQKTRSRVLQVLATLLCAALADLIHADYRAAGVFSIVAFYIFFDRKVPMLISQALIIGVLPALVFFIEKTYHTSLDAYYLDLPFEGAGILALIFVFFYNGERGYPAKYLFYWFYPLHHVALYIGQLLLH